MQRCCNNGSAFISSNIKKGTYSKPTVHLINTPLKEIDESEEASLSACINQKEKDDLDGIRTHAREDYGLNVAP